MQDGDEIIPAEHETGVATDPQPEPTPENPGAGHEEPTVESPAPETVAEEAPAAETPAEAPAVEVHADDSGDSQPEVHFGKQIAGIVIVVDGAQKFNHTFMPNSTPMHDSVAAALKHADGGIDLDALAPAGYTMRVNGQSVDPKDSSLTMGIEDGAIVEIELG